MIKRWFNFIKWFSLIFSLLLFALVLMVWSLVVSEGGRKWLAQSVVYTLNQRSNVQIDIGDIITPSLSHWTITSIDVRRHDRTLVNATQLQLRWEPGRLWDREIYIEQLQLDTLRIAVTTGDDQALLNQNYFLLPQFEWINLSSIHLKRAHINRITLDGLLARSQSMPDFSLRGDAQWIKGRAPQVRLEGHTLNQTPALLKVEAYYDAQRRFMVDGTLTENPGGTLAGLLMLQQQGIEAKFQLAITRLDTSYSIDIQRMQFPIANHRVEVQGKGSITADLASGNIQTLSINVDDTTHQLIGSWDHQNIELTLELDALPLGLFGPWITELRTGQLSANLTLCGPIRSAKMAGNLSVNMLYQDLPLIIDFVGSSDTQLTTIESLEAQWGDGFIRAHGTLDWLGDNSDLSMDLGQLDLINLRYIGFELPKLLNARIRTAKAQIRGPAKALQGTATVFLDGHYDQLPFSLRTTLTKPSDTLFIEDTTVSIAERNSSVTGSINLNTLMSAFTIDIESMPLSMVEWLDVKLPNGMRGHINSQVKLEGRLSNNALRQWRGEGTAIVQGRYQNKPFALNTTVIKSSDSLVIKDTSLILDEGLTTISGTVDTHTGIGQMNILAEAIPLTLLELAGILLPDHLMAHFSGHMMVEGKLYRGNINTLQSAGTAVIVGHYKQQPFKLNATLAKSPDLLVIKEGVLSLNKQMTTIQGTLNTQNLNGKMLIKTDALPLSLIELVDIQLPDELEAVLKGELTLEGSMRHPSIRGFGTLTGQYHEVPFLLQGKGESHKKALKIESLTLSTFDKQTMSVYGYLNPEQLDLSLIMNPLPTQLLAALGWDVYDGQLNANFQVSGSIDQPDIHGTLNYKGSMPHFDTDGEAQDTAFNWKMDVTTNEGFYTLSNRFIRDDNPHGQFQVQFPQALYSRYLNQSEPFEWQHFPLEASLTANLDLKTLSFLLDPELHRVKGKINGQFELNGTLIQPIINGSLRITNGRYQNPIIGMDVNNIQCSLSAKERVITFNRCDATEDKNGQYQLLGLVRIPQYRDFGSVNVNLRVSDANIMHRTDIESVATGELQLIGNFKTVHAKGTINVTPLTAMIDVEQPDNIPRIKVTKIDDSSIQKESSNQSTTVFPNITLDIDLNAEQQAFLRGRGLEAEMKGQVFVRGTVLKPRYDGTFQLIRGVFEVFGKKFTLEHGEVIFANNVISVNIEGIYSKLDHQIQAQLSGTPSDLKLKLTSSPSMAEDEILAFIIFGKSVQTITPFEAIQIASAVKTLQGGGGFDPINSARDLLGFDTLAIETESNSNGETDVNVGIGKYLNEKVYLELERTSNPSQPWKGNLQIELTPNLQLKSSTGGTRGIEGAELKWKRDY